MIGDAIVSGSPIPIGDMYVELMQQCDFTIEQQRWIRTIKATRKSFNFCGYWLSELDEAFRLVQDSEDWRKPIDAVVNPRDLGVVVVAVAYYTATACVVMPTEGELIRVHSVGYRAGPAGP